MKTLRTLLVSALAGAVALAVALPASAQNYGTGTANGPAEGSVFNSHPDTPESDGRPGEYYFGLGVQAIREGDYRHAVDMYKVAASWAYKTAEYNLGIMYFKGQGVPVDRPRGTAWMILAAEGGNTFFVKARDLMVTALTKPEFQQTDEIWNQLKPTYSDAVALQRAKARWAQTRASATGTRVGATGSEYLMVGNAGSAVRSTMVASSDTKNALPTLRGTVGTPPTATGWGVFNSGSIEDGSVSYQQFQQSDNPYDPIFVKNKTGNVMVEPLQPVKTGEEGAPKSSAPPASSSDPSQDP